MSDDEIISGFVSELRRGTVVLGVLNQLSTPKYGYSLGQELTEKGVPVDGNTLYPLRFRKASLFLCLYSLLFSLHQGGNIDHRFNPVIP